MVVEIVYSKRDFRERSFFEDFRIPSYVYANS